jgi:hypothetical protein
MNGTVTAKTAADGSFLLPTMPFGRFRIRVQEGSGDWVAGDLSGATHPIMQTLRVPDLVLQYGVLLTGVVLGIDTGEPLSHEIKQRVLIFEYSLLYCCYCASVPGIESLLRCCLVVPSLGDHCSWRDMTHKALYAHLT